jgi:localization factor PodJL
MSRIKSQLEALRRNENGSPARPSRAAPPLPLRNAASAPAYSPIDSFPSQPSAARNVLRGAVPDEMSRLRDRLDQLGSVIGQLSAAQSASKAQSVSASRPAPVANAGYPDIAGIEQALANSTRISAETNSHIDRLNQSIQRELSELRNQYSEFQRNSASTELKTDMQRVAEGIARLQERGSDPTPYLDEIAAELHEMRQAILGSSFERGGQDIAALARSIEDSHAEIVARLESALAHPKSDSADSRQIAALSDHVAAMREAVEGLPMAMPVDALQQQLGQISETLSQFAGRGDHSIQRGFRQVEDRLDEVARALVAVSVAPTGDSSAAIERVEARLSTLASLVEGLAQGYAPADAAEGQAPHQDMVGIRNELHRLTERLDALHSASFQGEPLESALMERLDHLARHIDSLQGFTPAETMGDSATQVIIAELGDISARLSTIERNARSRAEDVGGGQFAATSGSGLEADFTLSLRPIEQQLAILVDRLDQLGEAAIAQPFADERLAALEQTLSEIASRLDTVSGGAIDYSPLVQRLDSIEEQLTVSREIAVEAAVAAAERALQQIGTREGQPAEGGFVGNLDAELRALEHHTRNLSELNSDGFEAVMRMLETLGQRIGDLEAGMQSPVAQPAQDNVAFRTALAGDRLGERPARPLAGDLSPEADQPMGGIESTMDAWPARDGLPAQDQVEVSQASPDDVPLEPGSGVPDLAALVRDASKRRKAVAETQQDPGPQDFLAAARRAAQMAAADAAASATAKEQKKEPVRTRAANLGTNLFAGRRKLLIAAGAAFLLLAAAVPLASRLMGSGKEPAAVEVGQLPQKPEERAPQDAAGNTKQADATSRETPTVKPVEDDIAQKTNVSRNDAATAEAPAGAGGESPDLAALEQLPQAPEEAGNAILREAAAQGDPSALFEIGRRYTDGDGVERDLAKAAIWYEAAARSGSAPAQYRYANFLEKGHGVPLDVEKSALWYQRAAEQGNALAMHNLAVIHTTGLVGGKPDMETALGWFHKAAELGVKDSQVNLGIIYAKGLGVETDLVAAYKWLSVAARGGDTDAASKRDTLASAMRPEQLEKARGEAEQWKPAELDPVANIAVVLPEWKPGGESAAATMAPASAEPQAVTKEMIAKVQSLLAGMGYNPGPADGEIGARTREAILAFQKKVGMTANGEVSAELLKKLADKPV